MAIDLPVVLNFEPHYLLLHFKRSYSNIKGRQILAKVVKAIGKHFETSKAISPLTNLHLRYIADETFAFQPTLWTARDVAARLGAHSVHSLNPSELVRDRAILWYRTLGHHITSEPVDIDEKLRGEPPSSGGRVRWYVLVDVTTEPLLLLPSFIPRLNAMEFKREQYVQVIKQELHDRLNPNGAEPPSTVSRSPAKFDAAQAGGSRVSMGQRPYEDYGPLPSFFCPPLAAAYNRLRNKSAVVLEDAADDDNPASFDLMVWLADFAVKCGQAHKTEEALLEAVEPCLLRFLDDPGLKKHFWFRDVMGPVAELDLAAESFTAHGLAAIYFAVEFKLGKTADALVQALHALKRTLGLARVSVFRLVFDCADVSSYQFSHLMNMSFYPCIVMTVEGPYVSFSLVYFTDKVNCARLFDYTFTGGPERILREIAPSFQIVRDAAVALRKWYGQIHTGTTLPHSPHLFPNPSGIVPYLDSLTPNGNSKNAVTIAALNIIFIEKVGPDSKSDRILYRGIIAPSGQPLTHVYVKFVERYGVAPHTLLAGHHLAPQLFFAGEVLNGLTMVVMQALEGDCLPEVFPKHYLPVIRRDIGAAKDLLQAHVPPFVHGDIRPPNVVMVNRGGRKHAYLIDFDWSGEDGVEKYPNILNPQVKWPRPVNMLQGKRIRGWHDNNMFAKLCADRIPDDPPPSTEPPAKKLRTSQVSQSTPSAARGGRSSNSNAHRTGSTGNGRHSSKLTRT
ncbi:hypothetical protein GSI_09572 [Ganoderma sinense ZZ0214-1]|uniref:Protein kinase domain-containing protein n=1 Tax=Ganoderma sinense ZZ0214-1 TaxID=1077348 RepID=A0A2G8S3F7_9APHY|nr:hypothetical protein GSI_09572 [Ganoderma sinense ZZ0214-1]